MPIRQKSPRVVSNAVLDVLEPRLVLAVGQPTAYEQYMLELINRARANPAAEAARLGISLNEGLAAGTISTAAKQPLSMNVLLNLAARGHANWLLSNSKFQHAGPNNNTPRDRMAGYGYAFNGTNGSAENIGMTLSTVIGDLAQRVESIYKDLFLDTNVAGRGHRVNIFNATLDEMGSGVVNGGYTYNGSSKWTAVISSQDFAYSSGNAFVTGVIFKDNLKLDNFYSPGEGMSGITITLTPQGGGTSYTTTTNQAGGYNIQVPDGSYALTAAGPSYMGTATASVTVNQQNVKVDFKSDQFKVPIIVVPLPTPTRFASFAGPGYLQINGTAGDDVISVKKQGTDYLVSLGTGRQTFAIADVKWIVINAGAGKDSVTVFEDVQGSYVYGGAGNDTILGTAGNDVLYGEDGDDLIIAGGGDDWAYGGLGTDDITGGGGKDNLNGDEGNDRLNGAGGADKLYGGDGSDRLYGADGDDWLEGGGGTDRLYGGTGADTMAGGSSNDRLYGDEGNDLLSGNKGTDYLQGGTGTNWIRDPEDKETIINLIQY